MKAYISCPMRGKTEQEISATRFLINDALDIQFGLDVMTNELETDPEALKHPLLCLSHSVASMPESDVFVFAEGFESARGCRVEYNIALHCGFDIYFFKDGKLVHLDDRFKAPTVPVMEPDYEFTPKEGLNTQDNKVLFVNMKDRFSKTLDEYNQICNQGLVDAQDIDGWDMTLVPETRFLRRNDYTEPGKKECLDIAHTIETLSQCDYVWHLKDATGDYIADLMHDIALTYGVPVANLVCRVVKNEEAV